MITKFVTSEFSGTFADNFIELLRYLNFDDSVQVRHIKRHPTDNWMDDFIIDSLESRYKCGIEYVGFQTIYIGLNEIEIRELDSI